MNRLGRIWQSLDGERRLAAAACLLLIFSEFLPWYGGSITEKGKPISKTLTAIGAFSLVELAILVLAGAVLFLLAARAENRAFHLPGSDGAWIAVAGFWATFLIVYRLLDRPEDLVVGKLGPRWGMFIALAATITLAIAGLRERRRELDRAARGEAMEPPPPEPPPPDRPPERP